MVLMVFVFISDSNSSLQNQGFVIKNIIHLTILSLYESFLYALAREDYGSVKEKQMNLGTPNNIIFSTRDVSCFYFYLRFGTDI